MNEFIERHQLKGVNVYVDNITDGGRDQKMHDENLGALKDAANKDCFTFNEDKCQYNCNDDHKDDFFIKPTSCVISFIVSSITILTY